MQQGMAGRYGSSAAAGSANGAPPGQQQHAAQQQQQQQQQAASSGMMAMHGQDGYNLQRAVSGSHEPLTNLLGRSVGTGGNAPFDMSDFPALAQNRSGTGVPPSDQGTGSYAMHIAQQDRSQHQPDFAMQSEDFPALGGAPGVTSSPGSGPRQNPLDASNGGRAPQQAQQFFQQQSQAAPQPQDQAAPGASKPRSNGAPPPGVLGGFDAAGTNGFSTVGVSAVGGSGSSSSTGLGSLGGVSDLSKVGVQQQPVKKAPGPREKQLPPEQHYGLLGLLSVLRMEDADRGTLALGTDLTMLGLNLNSSESLHTSFASPWSDRQSTRDPPFQLPACYNNNNNSSSSNAAASNGSSSASVGAAGGPGAQGRSAPRHFSKYELETLFYIFYAMPRDIAQVQAAQELYKRKWRFHTEHKVWFLDSKELPQPPAHQLPPDVPQYIYFDIQAWERRLFTNASLASSLDTGFMPSNSVFSIGSAQSQQHQTSAPPGSLGVAAPPAAQASS